MKSLRLAGGLLLSLWPASLTAQLSEVRPGVIGSYAASDAYRAGAGVTLGYAPARIAYVGVRYIYHFGSTSQATDDTGTFDVTDRTQLFGVDLGLEFPVGAMELVIGGTLGVVRFSQRVEPTGSTGEAASSDIGTGFVAAPLALLHVRVGPIMLVPQVTWYFAGDPDFRWQVDHSGPAASLAIVLPIETDRIRY